VGNGGRLIDSAGVQGEVGVVGEEGRVGEVNLDKPPSRGPLRGVEDAGVHPHGLLAQVWVAVTFIVLEHPDQHIVYIHSGETQTNHHEITSTPLSSSKTLQSHVEVQGFQQRTLWGDGESTYETNLWFQMTLYV
jgi:hypothetical protein